MKRTPSTPLSSCSKKSDRQPESNNGHSKPNERFNQMVTDETEIKKQVDGYIGKEFHSFEDIMKLPPCILEDAVGVQWVKTSEAAPQSLSRKLDQQNTVKEKPFRVTHLIELHEVPEPKSDAPELELDAARRFTFEVRTDFLSEPMQLEIESPCGTWWYATLRAPGSTLHATEDGWRHARATQFATAKEALAAAWATPEIKGLA